MEINRVCEVAEVAEAPSRVRHLLDLRIHAFTGGVRDRMLGLDKGDRSSIDLGDNWTRPL